MMIFKLQFWLVIMFMFFIILWFLYGGKNHKFVGLSPLYPDYNMKDLQKDTKSDFKSFVKKCNKRRRFTGDYRKNEKSDERLKEIEVSDDTDDSGDIYDTDVDDGETEKSVHENDVIEESDASSVEKDVIETEELVNIDTSPEDFEDGPTRGLNRKSLGQRIGKRCLETWFKVPFREIRPGFLKNPDTGQNLELDCFNPDFRLAMEYNGIQHYKYPNRYTKDIDEFKKQIQRDKFKFQRCNENGVHLIVVPYNIKPREIPQFIKDRLPPHLRGLAKIPDLDLRDLF